MCHECGYILNDTKNFKNCWTCLKLACKSCEPVDAAMQFPIQDKAYHCRICLFHPDAKEKIDKVT